MMSALEPLYRWRLPADPPVSAELLEAGRRRGISSRLLRLLAARRIDARGLDAFFEAPGRGLHDPRLLPDADLAASRIDRAVAADERVLVFGDFDADGLTGLAILTLALRQRGLDAEPYVPSRRDEGHGLSLAAIGRAQAEGRTLIVTVDCGTSSIVEIADAAAAGIDVLVTDHHQVPALLPPCPVVNPHRPGNRYPDPRLTGAGVAFKVAQLVLDREPRGAEAVMAMADLAAIGTVADVAPIAGENHSLARLGLALLRQAPRPGVASLLRAARIDRERLDLEDLAFQVAPRLNAAGRVGEAATAARLLLATEEAEADTLAAQLEAANIARRALLATCLDEARACAESEAANGAIVLAGPWPVGIVGLVAGRLAEEFGVPAVVFSTEVSPWRGSARSAGHLDLARAFDACGHLFERFGGHPQAAGCNLREENFGRFRERFRALAGPPPEERRRELALDLVLPAGEVDYSLYRELELLAPTGPGNPSPLLGVGGLVVTRVRSAGSGHTQLTVRKGAEVLDAIAFDRGDLADRVREGDRVDVVARLMSRTFGGFESLQLEVRDVAAAGQLAACAAGAGAREALPALAGSSGRT
ncbi:MAG: single-stranded-DNA-specific exonuclease RecJ, partial [Chloroflexota bacterium]|nr:single-stranded-DNA-specific exonuclease RecJ [Chloroflexota bacterium]